jgi:hypothetical protein
MKKFAILAGLMGLALVIGVAGTSFHRSTKAEANATDLIAFNADVCAGLTHDSACYFLNNPLALAHIAAVLDGDVADPATYKDLVDASNAQLGELSKADPNTLSMPIPIFNSQTLWVLTFVSNDDPIKLTAEKGDWLSTGNLAADKTTPTSSFTGCPLLSDGATKDPDCDANATTAGDGVVVDLLYSGNTTGVPGATPVLPLTPGKIARGAKTIEALQSTDTTTQTLDYTVVGVPDNLSLKSLKTSVQEDSGAPCVLGSYSSNEFTQENALPDVSGELATVTDTDGTDLTGIMVSWQTADVSDIHLAGDAGPNPRGADLGLSPTIFKSDQASAPELACGGDAETGNKITAAVGVDDFNGNQQTWLLLPTFDAFHPLLVVTSLIDDNTKIAVTPKPATMTLAANPASLVCDGVNSSTVTATILGTDGKPVVAGNQVRFDVVALGTANPITTATDANGVATTKITPLSGVTAGVTADVTVRTVSCTGGSAAMSCFTTETLAGGGAANQTVTAQATVIVFDTDCKNPCRTETNGELDNLEANILVSCQQPAPTAAPPPATGGNVTPPRTGDGGYLP